MASLHRDLFDAASKVEDGFKSSERLGIVDVMCEAAHALARTAPEQVLADEILAELARARSKFPGDNVTALALVEEVGELAKALIDESRDRVRKEAIQVATMAMRVVLDGDQTLDGWRAKKGLDSLRAVDATQDESRLLDSVRSYVESLQDEPATLFYLKLTDVVANRLLPALSPSGAATPTETKP